jgi:ribose-phosphate pyrophosphokinase
VYCFATHGLFNGEAPSRVEASALSMVVVANTVPLSSRVSDVTSKIKQISVSKLLSSAIMAVRNGQSVSHLFDHKTGDSLLA